MFFNKKKPKLDAKVRFQHKQFTTKLGSARSYRRTTVAVPESNFQKWLAKVGLGSRWSQIGVGLFVLAILYLAYLPNFLTLKEIKITGLSETQTHDLESKVRDQIADSKFYSAQNNLFLFNTQLVQRAAAQLTSIDSIKSVKKNYKTHTLEVVAESKYEKYLTATPDKVFDLYNDGTFKSESGIKRSDWLNIENPSMIKIQLYKTATAQNGQQFFDSNLLKFLTTLNEQLNSLSNLKLAYFSFKETKAEVVTAPALEEPATSNLESGSESNPLQTEIAQGEQSKTDQNSDLKLPFVSSEVNSIFYKDTEKKRFFKVIFDSTRDSAKAVDDLKLLLAQTNPDRFNQLDYIDMRIESKAFICLLNAPCAR